MKTLVLLWLAIFVMAMSSAPEKINKQAERIRYVAIGDSYSIGEGASLNESWPAVLTRQLNAEGLHVDLVANPSRTGWTTQQAIDHELPIFVAANQTSPRCRLA
jgi:lysophospholipase L1-like esterase